MAPLVANAHPIGVHCLQVKLEKVRKFNGRLRFGDIFLYYESIHIITAESS